MKLTELKALDRIAKSDKTYDFLQHVFVMGDLVYACTPYIVIEVKCKELVDNSINPYFMPVSMEKATYCNIDNRYVKIDDCCFVDDYATWTKWEPDYFSRYFTAKFNHISKYNPKYINKIMRVFSAFKINVGFVYNVETGIVTFEGINNNYEIRALLLPMK